MLRFWMIALGVFVNGCSSAATEPLDESESAETGGGAGQAGTGGAPADAGRPDGSRPDGTTSGTGGAKPDVGAADGASAVPPKIGDTNADGLKLVWADEFDGPAIDRSVWGNEIGLIRNNERQYYTSSAENQFIENGSLVIRGIPSTQYPNADFTAASLLTKGNKFFKYGRIEARAKVPGAKGSWPAFWMMPEDNVYGGWPMSGEIDIMEFWSYAPRTAWGTANYDNNGYKYSQGSRDVGVDLPDDYHVFAILWTATSIDWFVDDAKYYTFDISQPIAGRKPFNESFYIIINLAIGGGRAETPDAVQWPDDYRVDWVRVWQ